MVSVTAYFAEINVRGPISPLHNPSHMINHVISQPLGNGQPCCSLKIDNLMIRFYTQV